MSLSIGTLQKRISKILVKSILTGNTLRSPIKEDSKKISVPEYQKKTITRGQKRNYYGTIMPV
jgi:hypothetical protein